MRKNVLITAIFGAALALAACSGDTGTVPHNGILGLEAAEAAQLNQAILGVSAGVRGQTTAARFSREPGSSQASGNLNLTFDETAPCAPGGNVGVAGTLALVWDDAARTSSVSADFGVAHAACAHRLESGEVVTLTGDPDIDVSLDAASGPNGVTSFIIRETGAFNWAKGAENGGRCTLDVTAQLNPATGQVALSGTFCGFPVTGTYQGD